MSGKRPMKVKDISTNCSTAYTPCCVALLWPQETRRAFLEGAARRTRPLGAQMSSGVKKSKKSAAAAQAQLISSPSAS